MSSNSISYVRVIQKRFRTVRSGESGAPTRSVGPQVGGKEGIFLAFFFFTQSLLSGINAVLFKRQACVKEGGKERRRKGGREGGRRERGSLRLNTLAESQGAAGEKVRVFPLRRVEPKSTTFTCSAQTWMIARVST